MISREFFFFFLVIEIIGTKHVEFVHLSRTKGRQRFGKRARKKIATKFCAGNRRVRDTNLGHANRARARAESGRTRTKQRPTVLTALRVTTVEAADSPRQQILAPR